MTNRSAPYRLSLWAALAAQVELRVRVLDEGSAGRGWAAAGQQPYDVARWPTRHMTRGEVRLYHVARRAVHDDVAWADCVILGGWESPAYWTVRGLARRSGKPYLVFYESTLDSQRFRTGPLARLRNRLLTTASGVVTAGAASSAAARAAGVPEGRVFTGFNAVDVEALHEQALVRRTESSSGHRYLFVGRLLGLKRVDLALSGLATSGRADDLMTIVGDGSARDGLERLADELGVADRVTWTGTLGEDDVITQLASHDTLILPSDQEVWGLVVNEALAAGLHCVVSDHCGIAPSVADMPGVFVCRPDADSVAAAMLRSRQEWRGPIEDPPILEFTNERFALTFLTAIQAALSPATTERAG